MLDKSLTEKKQWGTKNCENGVRVFLCSRIFCCCTLSRIVAVGGGGAAVVIRSSFHLFVCLIASY